MNRKGKRSRSNRVLVSFSAKEYHIVNAATPYIGEGRTSLGNLCRRASVQLAKNTLRAVGILDQVNRNFEEVSVSVGEPEDLEELDDVEESEDIEESDTDDLLERTMQNVE